MGNSFPKEEAFTLPFSLVTHPSPSPQCLVYSSTAANSTSPLHQGPGLQAAEAEPPRVGVTAGSHPGRV